jgi:hypothetical protein
MVESEGGGLSGLHGEGACTGGFIGDSGEGREDGMGAVCVGIPRARQSSFFNWQVNRFPGIDWAYLKRVRVLIKRPERGDHHLPFSLSPLNGQSKHVPPRSLPWLPIPP